MEKFKIPLIVIDLPYFNFWYSIITEVEDRGGNLVSNAEIIFSRLQQEGYSYIKEMINTQQEENLFLEFKLKSPKSLYLEGDDRKNYAKALSGFSNTAGGVLIWGILAEKNLEGVDAAKDLKPIEEPKRILGELNSLLSSALTPVNPGIVNHLIPLPEDSKKGFIVTYVPESALPPHRALVKLNQYYTRSGDSFVMMEHVHLEDMFGRRQKPILDIFYEVNNNTYIGIPRAYDFSITFGIKNIGKYVARFPAIRIKPKSIIFNAGSTSNYVFRFVNHTEKDGAMLIGGADDIIHPNTHLIVGKLDLPYPIKEEFFIKPDLHPRPDLSFEYTIYSEGTIPVSDEVRITIEDLKKKITS
ncbi:AlbA family DNA-binding domain-containing protein [Terribacillus saccharophilus]|uniref:AlbA family DNA-binding domain-containing protein n=1 Tax=Terribacillus saccharophilus TaxID=361277 RepID=UPI00159625F4|nr:ATP-binding protein [Terribacillus saccharophilus]